MAKPGRSEWGKINEGQVYRVLGTDFGRALFGVSWPAHTLPLVFYVIERSWAPFADGGKRIDAVPVAINFGDLARQWDVPKQRLYEARDFLVDNAILVDDGGFLLNTRVDHWGIGTPGSDEFRPLVKPAMLAYAAAARTRKTGKDASVKVTPQRDREATHKRSSVTPQRDRKSRSSVTGGHAPALPEVTPQRDSEIVPPRTPIEERTRRDLDLIQIETKASQQLLSPEPEVTVTTPRMRLERAQAERRDRLVDRAMGVNLDADSGERIDDLIVQFGLEEVEHAVYLAVSKDDLKSFWGFIAVTLKNRRNEGKGFKPPLPAPSPKFHTRRFPIRQPSIAAAKGVRS